MSRFLLLALTTLAASSAAFSQPITVQERRLAEVERMIPFERRMTRAEEIADTVVFLLSDRASHTALTKISAAPNPEKPRASPATKAVTASIMRVAMGRPGGSSLCRIRDPG